LSQISKNEFPQVDVEPFIEAPPAHGQITPQPPSPDMESSETESHQVLLNNDNCSSPLLVFDQYFLPLSSSIITSMSENDQIVYTCSKGPDDLPGLKAWTLVVTPSSTHDLIGSARCHQRLM
jgi:hypothetical protein